MEMKRASYAIFLLIWVCNLFIVSSEGLTKKLYLQTEAWNHCTKEMGEKRVAKKEFDLCTLQATDGLISTLLAKQSIHKAISTLPPQVREGVLDCLRKNGLVFDAFNPEVTSSNIRPHPSGSVLDYSLHVSKKVSSSKPGNSGKRKKKKGMMTIVIAIAATSVTTFVLVAVVFFCCLRKTTEPKDEKPLLHLNDYLSEGSSHKSISLGSSSNKESTTSDHNNPSSDSSLDTKQDDGLLPKPPGSDATVGAGLKPPPGRPAPPPPPPTPAPSAPTPPPPPPAAAIAHAAPPPPPPRVAPPPPPPKGARAPPMPPKSKVGPLGGRKHSGSDGDSDSSQKAKLKPFFWDKVAATGDQSMVWHEIRGGSFQFNEEMIETLFGYQATNNKSNEKKDKPAEPAIQYIQIIDARKAQNLSILLRALNVTTHEVINALQEGHKLPGELLHTLQKMTPTPDEELKLRLFAGDINRLGPAERFLKTVVEIPFAFKRIDALMFMSTFPEEVVGLKESFATLEVACTKLKDSRLFMKLLEAVLKTGNRMNDGTYRGGAQAFKLDTLLKLSDVKGTDGKTTLLHFVVQEIIRYEGIRCVRAQSSSHGESLGNFKAVDFIEGNDQDMEEHYRNLGLEVVSGLTSELRDIKKAAVIDADALTSSVTKLDFALKKTKEFLNTDMKGTDDEATQFYLTMSCFTDAAEADIKGLSKEEKRIMELIKSTADYFHGQAGMKEGLRLFTIVRDFLTMLEKVCKEIRDTRAKQQALKPKDSKKEGSSGPTSQKNQQQSSLEHQQDKDSKTEGSSALASQENQQKSSLECQQDKVSEEECSSTLASQENQQQSSTEPQKDKDSKEEGSSALASQENQQQFSLEHQQDKDSKEDGLSAQASQQNQQQSSSAPQEDKDSKDEGSSTLASQENQQQTSSEPQQDKDSKEEGSSALASQENQQQFSSEHQQDKDSKEEDLSMQASQQNQQQSSSEPQEENDSKEEGSSTLASQENQQQYSSEPHQDKDSKEEGSSEPASRENQQQPSFEQQDKDSKKEDSSQENQQQSSSVCQRLPLDIRKQLLPAIANQRIKANWIAVDNSEQLTTLRQSIQTSETSKPAKCSFLVKHFHVILLVLVLYNFFILILHYSTTRSL
ncbi:hypothetical protein GQ457_15G012260 [Hibiscus cannabinus]